MEDTQHIWNKAYLEALDHDTWGQVEEACDGYQRLQVAAAVEHVENVLGLPTHRRDAIGKLATVLKLRIQELNSGVRGRIGLSGMQSLKPFMAGLIITDVTLPPGVAAAVKAAPPPAALVAAAATESSIAQQFQKRASVIGQPDGMATTIYNPNDEADSIAEVTSKLSVMHKPSQHSSTAGTTAAGSSTGTLRPPIPAEQLQPGDITLSINFVSWAVKGASQMVDPHIVVTVRESNGKLLEAVQESPQLICYPSDPDKLGLGFNWHMQTAVNCLPQGAAVFFELRHYKPEKKKKSIKCFSYLELSELRTAGNMVLEIYKKPADYKRKSRPTLLTTKAMYLQLSKALTTH